MKNYPPEVKADAVALHQSRPGATARSVAADLGVNPETGEEREILRGRSISPGRRAGEPLPVRRRPPAPLRREAAETASWASPARASTTGAGPQPASQPGGPADGLAARIRTVHQDSDGTYGVPGITAELRETGELVNHKRVARIMLQVGLAGLRLRRKHRTTIADPAASKAADLIGRDFTAAAVNTKYLGDITYLPLAGGKFMYPATVIDFASRRLAGWAIADHMRSELVNEALAAAERCRGSLAGASQLRGGDGRGGDLAADRRGSGDDPGTPATFAVTMVMWAEAVSG
ncbi:IS3 family transposase [Streptomyces sp. NPDC006332]|uniref:IS3 family transposase n=1 Tax=Streptomyces sp. NPDC006332 TaxID=3155456 RepID=UPI0033B38A79